MESSVLAALTDKWGPICLTNYQFLNQGLICWIMHTSDYPKIVLFIVSDRVSVYLCILYIN
jgi:hypothetical protein